MRGCPTQRQHFGMGRGVTGQLSLIVANPNRRTGGIQHHRTDRNVAMIQRPPSLGERGVDCRLPTAHSKLAIALANSDPKLILVAIRSSNAVASTS